MFGGNQKSTALQVTRKGPFTFQTLRANDFWLKAECVNNLSYQVGVVEKSRGGSDVTEGYNTTLTFGEMVAIYHDIWNTMLKGSLSALSHGLVPILFLTASYIFFCYSLQHHKSCC